MEEAQAFAKAPVTVYAEIPETKAVEEAPQKHQDTDMESAMQKITENASKPVVPKKTSFGGDMDDEIMVIDSDDDEIDKSFFDK